MTIQVWGKDTLNDDSHVVQTEVDLSTQQDLCLDKIGKPTGLILPVYKIGLDKPAGNVVVSLSLMPKGSRSALGSEANAKAARAEAEAKTAAAAKAKAAGEAKQARAKAAAAAKANAKAEKAKAKAQAHAKAAVEKERKKMKSTAAGKCLLCTFKSICDICPQLGTSSLRPHTVSSASLRASMKYALQYALKEHLRHTPLNKH